MLYLKYCTIIGSECPLHHVNYKFPINNCYHIKTKSLSTIFYLFHINCPQSFCPHVEGNYDSCQILFTAKRNHQNNNDAWSKEVKLLERWNTKLRTKHFHHVVSFLHSDMLLDLCPDFAWKLCSKMYRILYMILGIPKWKITLFLCSIATLFNRATTHINWAKT